MEEKDNLSNEINKEKNIKTRKIGRFTFGIVLVLIGILIFIQTITTIDTVRYIMMLSPLIFISLGVEVLILSRKNDIKYDFIGVILTFLTLGAGWIFCGINYGVNKVLYSDEIVNAISQREFENKLTYNFDDTLNISNVSDKNINLNIIENNNVDETIVYIKYNFKNQINNNNIIDYFINDYNYNDSILRRVDYENNILMIIDVKKEIENIEIKVITNNKDNVKYEGNFNINNSMS